MTSEAIIQNDAKSTTRGLLLIADIAGYTRFMKAHRTSLAHAQDIVARLLEAMIDAVPDLTLVEVEGDAAFLYQPLASAAESVIADSAVQLAREMHRAFHLRQQGMVARNACPCDGCTQSSNLKVKFVAHLGEVATQRVKTLTRLAGLDVIVVHRMLKNAVPVPEYVLMSDPLFAGAGAALRARVRAVEQELEGLGRARAYFLDLAHAAASLPAPPRASGWDRKLETWALVLRTLPRILGIAHPGPVLRNLPAG
jgi:class 3 adenylate cyclase